jgi:hypothetical protein
VPSVPLASEIAPQTLWPHATAHDTPAFERSFVTVAVSVALLELAMLAGALRLTDMVDALVIVAIAVAVCSRPLPSVALAVAVMVTMPPVGTVGGAV